MGSAIGDRRAISTATLSSENTPRVSGYRAYIRREDRTGRREPCGILQQAVPRLIALAQFRLWCGSSTALMH